MVEAAGVERGANGRHPTTASLLASASTWAPQTDTSLFGVSVSVPEAIERLTFGTSDAKLRSMRLLADAMEGFKDRPATGLELDRGRTARHPENSLMLVTGSFHQGYAGAKAIAHEAHAERHHRKQTPWRPTPSTASGRRNGG